MEQSFHPPQAAAERAALRSARSFARADGSSGSAGCGAELFCGCAVNGKKKSPATLAFRFLRSRASLSEYAFSGTLFDDHPFFLAPRPQRVRSSEAASQAVSREADTSQNGPECRKLPKFCQDLHTDPFFPNSKKRPGVRWRSMMPRSCGNKSGTR